MAESDVPPPVRVRLAWWQWPNALALDAVAVALAWLHVFAAMTGARMTPVNSLALGAAVWLIYMTDRLADGWSGAGGQGRHTWAFRNRRWLLPVMAAVTGFTAWAVLTQMRWVTVQGGMRLAAGVGLYFCMLAASRWKAVSQVLLLGVTTLLVMGLVQRPGEGPAGIQLWRAIVAGTLLTTIYFSLRQPFAPPPWALVKKSMSGCLFALGVALGPYSHLQDWRGLLFGAPVLLFAGACMLNSTGIRLWEKKTARDDPEYGLLLKLYPWLLAAVGGGALAQAVAADAWARPVLAGVAGCVAGFALLHFFRARLPERSAPLLADGLMLGVALLVRFGWMRELP